MATAGRAVRRLLENWEQQILRPIVTSLMTALLLFAASLAFRPVRAFLFPPKVMAEYPLICTAEPYWDAEEERVLVDFFVINRKGEPYSREDLSALLRERHVDEAAGASPDIYLRHSRFADGRPIGLVDQAVLDAGFNAGKGQLRVEHDEDVWLIQVDRIEQRAVMKVTLRLARFDVEPTAVQRTAKVQVPFTFSSYEDACYTRKE